MTELKTEVSTPERPETIRTDLKVQSLLDAIAEFQAREGWTPNRISRTLTCYEQTFPPLTKWLRQQGLIGEQDHVGASGSVGQYYSTLYSTNHRIYVSNVPQGLSRYEPEVLFWNHPFLLRHAPGYIDRLNKGKLPINDLNAWFFIGNDSFGAREGNNAFYIGNISLLPELRQNFHAHQDELGKIVLDTLGHGEDSSGLREIRYRQLEGRDFRVHPEDLIPVGSPQAISGLRLDRKAAYIVQLELAVELQFPDFEHEGTRADGWLPLRSDPKAHQYAVQFYKLKENARFMVK